MRTSRGRSERDLAAVQAEHPIPRARLLHVVRRDHHGTALAGEIVDQLHELRGAGLVEAGERLVQQQQVARPARARARPARAGAGRRTARRRSRVARSARPTAPSASSARRRSARPGRRHHGSRASVPISATSSALTGIVEARALGLRHRAAAAADRDRPRERLQLAQQHAEERRLAAAVGAQHADAHAALDRERDVLDRGRARVAGGQVAGRRKRAGVLRDDRVYVRHPRLPPVKPLTIASAFAASIFEVSVAAGALGPERVAVQLVTSRSRRSRARESRPPSS